MKICIFTVGGTIDKIYFDQLSEYQVGKPGVTEILDDLPVAFDYTIESLLRKDSLDMTDADRALVRDRVRQADADKILVTHGTDTMIETARCIEPSDSQCVVFTGALSPAGFRTSDAEFNVGMAVGVLAALRGGVHLVMNGCLFDPWKSRKNRALGRFETIPEADATS